MRKFAPARSALPGLSILATSKALTITVTAASATYGDTLGTLRRLAAPVLHEGETERSVYLPKGDWFDYWTGHRFVGGQSVTVPVTLASIPWRSVLPAF